MDWLWTKAIFISFRVADFVFQHDYGYDLISLSVLWLSPSCQHSALICMIEVHLRIHSTIWPVTTGMMKKVCYVQTFSYISAALFDIYWWWWWLSDWSVHADMYWYFCCYVLSWFGFGFWPLSCWYCKRCLLIHMNNKDWYFFLWKKKLREENTWALGSKHNYSSLIIMKKWLINYNTCSL